MNDNLPEGTIAFREYEVPMPDGSKASIELTLGDLSVHSMAADFARQNGALAYGLVNVVDLDGAPDFPLIWTQGETEFGITVADGDPDPTDELKAIIARFIGVFFADIATIAPELAALSLSAPKISEDQRRPVSELSGLS